MTLDEFSEMIKQLYKCNMIRQINRGQVLLFFHFPNSALCIKLPICLIEHTNMLDLVYIINAELNNEIIVKTKHLMKRFEEDFE